MDLRILTTWFWSSNGQPLPLWSPTHIYSHCQHSVVTWSRFTTFPPKTSIYFLVLTKPSHSEQLACLTTTTFKTVKKWSRSHGWSALQPSWITTIVGGLHYSHKSRATCNWHWIILLCTKKKNNLQKMNCKMLHMMHHFYNSGRPG